MYKIIVSHGRTYIDFPFREKTEAQDMYIKQVAHYAAECALLGDKCTVWFQDPEDKVIAKTDVFSNKK